MDTTSYVALSRQVALERAMTVIANNLANLGTTGFKAERMLFATVLERAGEPGRVAFVQDVATVRDDAQGALRVTGGPLDLAIQGEGFFTVRTAAGERYTRAGQLRRDASGALVTALGHELLDEGGQPLVLPPEETAPRIAADGTISGTSGVLGRIRLVRFADPASLRLEGEGLYASEAPPIPGAPGAIVQGALEESNVKGVLELARMIEVARAFEGTQKMLETHHELVRKAIERIADTTA
ncbi:MAG: flagellar basal-body rod protein FlgF [Geminicoccaceae bacterium]|nr:flagellar basal-body rod protein FlgF [Geminicoccaceae bacterium]MDW8341139.1 flagellar basal-body rod protein FlgF [Geminicoccaceae bacterium]